jgi:hypothetical protein
VRAARWLKAELAAAGAIWSAPAKLYSPAAGKLRRGFSAKSKDAP